MWHEQGISLWLLNSTLTGPDLQIRGGGDGHPDSKNNFFRAFGPPFGLKIRGGPGPSPGSPTAASGLTHTSV